MWFKNLRLYRLNAALDDSQLEERLSEKAFQPCGKLDPLKYGWVPPLGRKATLLSHTANGATLFCAKRQEKQIPAAALKEALENKLFEIQEEEGRPVGRKERQAIKDELIFTMLPQALPRSSTEVGYVHHADRMVLVNVSAAKKAEEFLSLLRESLGSLKAIPMSTHNPIAPVLTEWLRNGSAPTPFTLGEQCELRASKDERVIRFRKQDLSADEVRQHLDTGMHVRQLELNWRDTLSFVLDDEMAIKSMKFGDELLEKAGEADTDSAADAFDNEFTIMSAELSAFVKDLLEAFGGESELA